MSGGKGNEHIASVKWINTSTNETGSSTREAMISWIEEGNKAIVTDGINTATVGVVDATPKYLRTYADGKWNDNLLALPEY